MSPTSGQKRFSGRPAWAGAATRSNSRRALRSRALLLAAIVAVHSTIWVLGLLVTDAELTLRQAGAEFGATLALVLASVNLVLAARVRVLERWLDGLDKLFITHRLIGITVGLIVIVHAFGIPKSDEYTLARLGGLVVLIALVGSVIVAAAPRAPWRRLVPLRYDLWKSAHRFQGFIIVAAVVHSRLPETIVGETPLLMVYIYGFAAVGLAAWVYREVLFGRLGPVSTHAVEATGHPADDVIEVRLDAESARLERAPGQFAAISFAEGPSAEQHPFTISSPPGEQVRFSIKASGDFTDRLLGDVPVGSAVRLEGPYGRFDHRRGLPHQLWLAGGIGITPFLAMAGDLDASHDVTLVWSVSDAREAEVYAEELASRVAGGAKLDVHVHPSSERGHLEIASLDLDPPLASRSVFVCGPVEMRRSLLEQLSEEGVPEEETYFEEFRLR